MMNLGGNIEQSQLGAVTRVFHFTLRKLNVSGQIEVEVGLGFHRVEDLHEGFWRLKFRPLNFSWMVKSVVGAP
jgi:hypothetical protein